MMLVPNRVKASPIHGLGVFAHDPIRAGTPDWRFDAGLDPELPVERIAALPAHVRDWFGIYGYTDVRTGTVVLCFDGARFMNHADAPNTRREYPPGDPFGIDVAARDIAAGEEITTDYRDLEGHWTP